MEIAPLNKSLVSEFLLWDFFLLKTCLVQGEKKEIPQCCTMAFHGKCEQGSTNPAQGVGDRPREGFIKVLFGQAGSLFGVIDRSVGKALLTGVQVRGHLQECWLKVAH